MGDASGDLHGAGLAAQLRERDAGIELFGLGGPAMQAAGVEIVASSSSLAIGGFVEILRSLRLLRDTWKTLLDCAASRRPDLVVLVDSGGFNLPLARALRRVCDAPILYFVAPQVWAWRRGRIRKLARRVDRVAVILPFEVEHYEGAGVAVDFVGHPLVDAMARDRETDGLGDEVDARARAARARSELGLPDRGPVAAFLPGSRRNEVAGHLAIQLDVMKRLSAMRPGLHCLLARAPSIDRALIETMVAERGDEGIDLHVVEGDSSRVLEAADVVLAKPGTGTTEAMLLRTPMVVMARVNPLTAFIVRRLIRVPYYAMPNLIAGRCIVPEFIQEEAEPEAIAHAMDALFEGPGRARQEDELDRAATRLGPPGAILRTTHIVFEMLAKREPGEQLEDTAGGDARAALGA